MYLEPFKLSCVLLSVLVLLYVPGIANASERKDVRTKADSITVHYVKQLQSRGVDSILILVTRVDSIGATDSSRCHIAWIENGKGHVRSFTGSDVIRRDTTRSLSLINVFAFYETNKLYSVFMQMGKGHAGCAHDCACDLISIYIGGESKVLLSKQCKGVESDSYHIESNAGLDPARAMDLVRGWAGIIKSALD